MEQVVDDDRSFNDSNDVVKFVDAIGSWEVNNSSGSILIEEIPNESIIVNKSSVHDLAANNPLVGQIDTLMDSETDPKCNTTKITFYCESVDKLMSDSVGDECDEIIHEVTPYVTVESI